MTESTPEELRRELVSVEEHNERLKSALREAKTQIESMRADLRRLGAPPLSRAVFEGFDGGFNRFPAHLTLVVQFFGRIANDAV